MTKPADNTIEARAAPFIDRVENLNEQLASEQGSYMARCKAIREDVKAVYAEAKDADLPVRLLKKTVKLRALERKVEALADDLEPDEVRDYEALVAALGGLADLPLGQAALDLADDDDDRDLRPRFVGTSDQAPADKPKRGRKPKPDAAPTPSPEEAAALADIERDGIAAAVAGATAH